MAYFLFKKKKVSRDHNSAHRMLEFATHFKQVTSTVRLEDLEWDLEWLLESAVDEVVNCNEDEGGSGDDDNQASDQAKNSSFKCIEAFNVKRRDADKELIDSIGAALESVTLDDGDGDGDDIKITSSSTTQKPLIEEISSTPS